MEEFTPITMTPEESEEREQEFKIQIKQILNELNKKAEVEELNPKEVEKLIQVAEISATHQVKEINWEATAAKEKITKEAEEKVTKIWDNFRKIKEKYGIKED